MMNALSAPEPALPGEDVDEINKQVAQRLRRLRRDRQLSLEDLAGRSGVSRAMLSQIETLKANPTIAVLWRVAGGLGVPVSELLGSGESPSLVRLSRAAEASYLYSADKSFRSRPLLAGVPGHRVELYELRLEPGGVERAQPHPPGTVEQVLVTRGALDLTVGEQTYRLATGDALLFPADQPHVYGCSGRTAFVGQSLILYAA